MFVNYPLDATNDNWIHEAICGAFTTVCNAISVGEDVPEWPDVLPVQYRTQLRRKTALRRRLNVYIGVAKKYSNDDRDEFLNLLHHQNNISSLLDGTSGTPAISDELNELVAAAKSVCDEGFKLLTKTGVRDEHYKIIWDALKSKKCPFCGSEPFDALVDGLHREDEDHYLARVHYPLAATNLRNLVPMGGKCNERYKGQDNVISDGGRRRRAIDPYGAITAAVSLINSQPLDKSDMTPRWIVDLLPDIEEVHTWESIFSVKKRIKESQLIPYYDGWLAELIEWFKVRKLNQDISDQQLFDEIDGYGEYSKTSNNNGPVFLQAKVAEMLVHHCKNGDAALIAMIRSGLPTQVIAA